MYRFVVVSYLVITFAGNSVSTEDELRKAWAKHLKRVSYLAFPCGNPQNRTVDVKELVDEDTLAEIENLTVTPRKTVLQRCNSTGSCKGKLDCLPYEIKKRHLIFGVQDEDNRLTFRNITVDDHMSCMCKSDTDDSK